MKCRIITNGRKFRIQKRIFLFWFTVKEYYPPTCLADCGFDVELEFLTFQGAVEKMKSLNAPKPKKEKWVTYLAKDESGYAFPAEFEL